MKIEFPKPIKKQPQNPSLRFLFLAILSLLAGFSWDSHFTVWVTLLFPMALIISKSFSEAFWCSIFYYLAILAPTPWALSFELNNVGAMSAGQYSLSMIKGIFLGIGMATVISLCWGAVISQAKRGYWIRPIGFLLVALIIPLFKKTYFFGIGSPISATGLLFPGSGIIGFVFLFLVVLSVESLKKGLLKVGLLVSLSMAMIGVFLNFYAVKIGNTASKNDLKIVAEGTSFDSERITPATVMKEFSIAFSDYSKGADVVVFPENAMGLNGHTTLKGLVNFTQMATVRYGKTLLIGEPETSNKDIFSSIVVIGKGGPRIIKSSATMPIMKTGVMPGLRYRDEGTPENEVFFMGKKRIVLSICYEEILSGLEIKKAFWANHLHSKEPIIFISLISNMGFPLPIANAQENSARLTARIFGGKIYRSVNR